MATLSRVLAGMLLAAASVLAIAAPPALAPQPFISGLASPVEIAHANDGSGRLFVLELGGRVRVIKNGALLPTPFLDLSAGSGGPVITGGERGLLGIAFHPAYLLNGRFYVYYTRALPGDSGGSEIVIARYARSAANADVANPASGVVVLAIAHPQQSNHNGGKIAFGADGYLYAGVGDGGGGGDPFNAAQNPGELRGKLLRLDVDGAGYAIPATNPFAGSITARGEFWSYGLRNPWKFSFDRATGDLFIGDVGQGAWEEIDFERRGDAGGRNFGWRVYEGTHCFNPPSACAIIPDHTPPIIEYAHDANGGQSVTGGYRYRGTGLAALAGYYVYGDFVSGRVWAAAPNGSGTWVPTQVATLASLSAFGEDEYGELYAANLGAGTIVRLTPATVPASTGTPITRYRLYNGVSFDHLYTTDFNEYNVLPVCCGWDPEGANYRLLSGPGSVAGVQAVPNYRLYNKGSRQHHWTTDVNEYNVLPGFGWDQEGIDGYILPSPASGTLPLYRLYLNAAGGLHLWTTDANERSALLGSGWVHEGIAGYVLPLP